MLCGSRTFGYALIAGLFLGYAQSRFQGCGAGADSAAATTPQAPVVSGDVLSAKHASRYAEIEECTDLSAVAPREQYLPLKPCPTSHRLCCMDDPRLPDFRASNGHLAGYAGTLIDGVIYLPQGMPCGDAFEHEAWRYLLQANGDPRWDAFDLPNLPSECS